MKKAVAFGVLLVLIGGGLFVPWIQVFSFEETRTNEPTKYYLKMSRDQQFKMVFTHSIHLTDVVESYEVLEDRRIKFLSMQYSDLAIGMPGYAEDGQTLIYEDGLYTLMYDNKTIREFNLYIGAVDYDLKFHYEARRYNLKNNLQKGHSYQFSIKRISIFDYLKGEKLHDEKG